MPRRSSHASASTDGFRTPVDLACDHLHAFLFRAVTSRASAHRGVLKDRKAKIEGDLQSARATPSSMRTSEAERYEAGIAAAKAKGHGNIRASREKLDAELDEKREVLDGELAAKDSRNGEKRSRLLERASGEMEAMTAGAVSDIVKELAGVEVSDSEVQRGSSSEVEGVASMNPAIFMDPEIWVAIAFILFVGVGPLSTSARQGRQSA